MKGLNEKALLIDLSIKLWGISKQDKKVTHEVANTYQVDATAGRYTKHILKSAEYDAIKKTSGEIRTFFYQNTLPWGTTARIRPTKDYDKFNTKLSELINKFDIDVNTFLNVVDDRIKEAQNYLKNMFNPNDYPSRNELKRKFGVHVKVLPLPTEDDFRVSLNAQEVNKIKEQLKKENKKSFINATVNIRQQLQGVVEHIATTLQDKDKKFKNSLTGNLARLIDTLPAFNFDNDSDFDKLINDCKQLLTYTPDQLRQDKLARQSIADKAEVIKEDIKTQVKNKSIKDELIEIF
jgi:hypothetical protein